WQRQPETMNSLQLGLIAVGVLIVSVLALVYAWQTWRAGRTASASKTPSPAQSASPRTADGGRDEPSVLGTRDASPADRRVEPVIESPPVAPAAAAAATKASEAPQEHLYAPERPNAHTGMTGTPETSGASAMDAIATAAPSSPAPTPIPARPARIASELPFDQRLHVHASIVSGDGMPFDAGPIVLAAGRARAWVRLFRHSPLDEFDPDSTASVQQVVLALPLASRAGPLTQADIDAWQFSVADATRQMNGEVHFHGLEDAAARAVELDQFLAAVDITPHIYLVKEDPAGWAGTRLRSTLEANGFRLQSDGRFAYHEVETDQVIFHAVDGYERPFTPERLRTESIKALRFVLQPVHLREPLARFDVYRQTLRALAKLLDGKLWMSDDTLVDEAVFAALREDVKRAMEALTQAGIEPGSDTARSLFV
ncbi:MAG: cell division protein ZipA C-terminal FtsZ-binding domain-containing protein, partial [Casimicrobiaceae bacterium]